MAPLLAFVDIFVESAHMDEVVQALSKLDNIEELYEVTGEFDIVTLVLADDIEEFRDVLKNKIMKIKGVKSTVSSIVLKTHKGARLTGEFLNPTPHASVAVATKNSTEPIMKPPLSQWEPACLDTAQRLSHTSTDSFHSGGSGPATRSLHH